MPARLLELVDTYERNKEAYQAEGYKEAQLRQEFIDPLLELLGWDVDNKAGNAPQYREVIHEDAIRIGGSTKAPDYCFRVGTTPKFFLEAKKPAVNLKDDPEPAIQLRRYGWSAKLPLCILTDFEELAIYDTRIRPKENDKAAAARVRYFTYKDYAKQWSVIHGTFSKDAVLKGSFDKWAASWKDKKGTSEVDDAFLEEIEQWRFRLARALAVRNPELGQRDLNFSVQRIIDRIIFLRICEDRGIETYGRLKTLQKSEHAYSRFLEFCRLADERYNSGLFHFRDERGRPGAPDRLTPGLVLDDRTLQDIVRSLYYPESPYEFSILPADILGQVYEQFLGKVIRLTEGHQAKVEDKPEVKKAGGVFYTPSYIVEYIVKNTIGRLLEGKTPAEGAKLRILDPACGSGSFLIAAYQYLLDWHRDWYVNHGPKKHKKELYEGPGGQWLLTTEERKRILLNSVFGVDIDAQAVETTKLSLLLKVLEQTSGETIDKNQKLFHARALPDLDANIKCGNSLIGPDFYDSQTTLFDSEQRLNLNVFDWKHEFPKVFKDGGFDAVIGNPPYIRMEEFKEIKAYLKRQYACHDERADIYAYFIEKEHHLLRPGGRFGIIVSNKFLRSNYGRPLRQFLGERARVEDVVDFAGLPVFRGATVRTVVLLTSRNKQENRPITYTPPVSPDVFATLESGSVPVEAAIGGLGYKVPPQSLAEEGWTFGRQEEEELLARLRERGIPLLRYVGGQVCMGIKSGLTEAFVIDRTTRDRIVRKNPEAEEILRPFLNGRSARRYFVEDTQEYLIYTYHGVDIRRYPAVAEHLSPFKERLVKRVTKQEWYELQQPQFAFKALMDGPKIVFPDIAKAPRFALDLQGRYGSNTTYFIPVSDLYLLALLNSRLGWAYFKRVCAGLEGKQETYLRFFGQYLAGFPVRVLNEAVEEERTLRLRIEQLVELRLRQEAERRAARNDHERTALGRQCEATDAQIDARVFKAYGLSDAEVEQVKSVTIESPQK